MYAKASPQVQPNQTWSGRVPQPPPPPSAQQWQHNAPTSPQNQGGSSQCKQGTMVQWGTPHPKGYDGAGRPYYTKQ
eukprot:7731920-Prorocentrum_lima.AAC.1